MGDPWKRRFRLWKPSFSGSMLVFRGCNHLGCIKHYEIKSNCCFFWKWFEGTKMDTTIKSIPCHDHAKTISACSIRQNQTHTWSCLFNVFLTICKFMIIYEHGFYTLKLNKFQPSTVSLINSWTVELHRIAMRWRAATMSSQRIFVILFDASELLHQWIWRISHLSTRRSMIPGGKGIKKSEASIGLEH